MVWYCVLAPWKTFLLPWYTRTEQNRTEQNKTEQNRTEQTRSEQKRTEQNRTEQSIIHGYHFQKESRTDNQSYKPLIYSSHME